MKEKQSIHRRCVKKGHTMYLREIATFTAPYKNKRFNGFIGGGMQTLAVKIQDLVFLCMKVFRFYKTTGYTVVSNVLVSVVYDTLQNSIKDIKVLVSQQQPLLQTTHPHLGGQLYENFR